MFKEKSVEATIEEIISCSKGHRKKIKDRVRIRDSVERRIRWVSTYRNHDYLGFEYEREYMSSLLVDDSDEQDLWVSETLSETYESGTNYTLKITYQHSEKNTRK